jgi:hypothetical protein
MSQGMTHQLSRTLPGGVSAMPLQVCALQVLAKVRTLPVTGPLTRMGGRSVAEAEGFEPSMGF